MKRALPFLVLASLLGAVRAEALPLYALSSAHTCGNCHTSPTYQDPNGWDNPELGKRKCSLSCVACHVNPTGGGLRNSSGRYFGRSSLAIIPYEERSYSDLDREFLSKETIQMLGMAPGRGARSGAGRTIPSNYADVEAGVGADAPGPWLAFGKPLFGPSEYSFWDGRYGDLSADPLLVFGLDARLAGYSGASSPIFPMQLDLEAALHPIEHLTLMATLAGRGRAAGFGAVTAAQDQLPVFMREAFVMVHELPYMAYLKAGIMMPPFGTYLDDHTSFIRKDFELSLSTSDSTVLGAEIGFSPNYPYANLAVFKNNSLTTAPDPTADPGFGAAASFGYRALGWSLGAHGMIKRRDPAAGGNFSAAGVSWGLAFGDLPLATEGELSLGARPAPLTGDTIVNLALYEELAWALWNGVSLKAKYDLGQHDLAIAGQLAQRFALGFDLAILPGLTILAQGRLLLPGGGADPAPDFIIQTHVWF